MSNILKTALCFALLSVAVAWSPAAITKANTGGFSITYSAGGASFSWDPISGVTVYTVTVRDLTTSQKITEYTTSSTSGNVSGLTSRHLYKYIIGDSTTDYVIFEDMHP